ncbi:hypothetical protein ACOMHN_060404 [Nucella lapillus]
MLSPKRMEASLHCLLVYRLNPSLPKEYRGEMYMWTKEARIPVACNFELRTEQQQPEKCDDFSCGVAGSAADRLPRGSGWRCRHAAGNELWSPCQTPHGKDTTAVCNEPVVPLPDPHGKDTTAAGNELWSPARPPTGKTPLQRVMSLVPLPDPHRKDTTGQI